MVSAQPSRLDTLGAIQIRKTRQQGNKEGAGSTKLTPESITSTMITLNLSGHRSALTAMGAGFTALPQYDGVTGFDINSNGDQIFSLVLQNVCNW